MPAGYVMTMGDYESVARAMEDGVYGTLLRPPPGYWRPSGYGTFADFASMRRGDNVYFFQDRQLYGIGELVDVGGASTHLNFPRASEPKPFSYRQVRSQLLYDTGEKNRQQRWICTFLPQPMFFDRGVDMDEALAAHPEAFRMLRVMWKVSFIKLDFEENAALKDVLLRVNRHALSSRAGRSRRSSRSTKAHRSIERNRTTEHDLDVAPFLDGAATRDWIRSEKALEAAILYYLSRHDRDVQRVLGRWDYVSHQVAASPFKPPDWMDKIDVFGAAFVRGHAPSVARLLVLEIKKGKANRAFVEQVMKYVDWVKEEYAHSDYSLIRAFLVAYDFDDSALEQHREAAVRRYTVGRRQPESKEWRDLTLVRYRFDRNERRLAFEIAASPVVGADHFE